MQRGCSQVLNFNIVDWSSGQVINGLTTLTAMTSDQRNQTYNNHSKIAYNGRYSYTLPTTQANSKRRREGKYGTYKACGATGIHCLPTNASVK